MLYKINHKELKQLVEECVHAEIAKMQRLDEMARVGTFNNRFDVVVFTDDPGYIPHIHIIDVATRGRDFDCCVQLDKNAYFSHGVHTDTMNSGMCRAFNEFMKQPSRNVHYRNNYEHAVNLWNDNNSNSYIQVKEDKDGNIIMPDYTTIQPYK